MNDKLLKDIETSLQKTADNLNRSFSRFESGKHNLDRRIDQAHKTIEEADEKLILFHHGTDDLKSLLHKFPAIVEEGLQKNMGSHMRELSDHIFAQMNDCFLVCLQYFADFLLIISFVSQQLLSKDQWIVNPHAAMAKGPLGFIKIRL